MKALVIRILKQIFNDRRTLALMLVAPLLVMTLVWLLLGDGNYQNKIAVYNLPENYIAGLQQKIIVYQLDSITFADAMLKSDSVDAVIWRAENGINFRALESGSKAQEAMKTAQEAFLEMMPMAKFNLTFVYDTQSEGLFNSLAYVFLGIISFFFTFIVAGMSMVREKFSQTLERVLITPIRRTQLVGGYMLGYGAIAALQGAVIALFGVYVLGIPLVGSVVWCIAVMVLLSFAAAGTGLLVSNAAGSEFQIMQFIPIIIIPQVFFTGLFPLESMPYGLGKLCYLMPVYYGCNPLKKIMLQGAGISEIWLWLLALAALIAVLFVMNVVILKKYRKI